MKHLGLSFGGTKIVGLFGVVEKLFEEGYKPDIISGISSGAILALPLALGKHKEMYELIKDLDLDTFMSKNPFNKKGKIKLSGILRFLFKGYFGEQNNIVKNLKKLVSRNEFEFWKKDQNRINVFVQTVDINTGSRIVSDLSLLDYEEALSKILASCSIPIYVKLIKTENEIFYDGGIRNFILTPYMLCNFPITENISVYSRPEDYKLLVEPVNNNMQLLVRIIDIFLVEISKKDEEDEKRYCREKNISSKLFYLPRVLNGVYDTNKERLNKLYLEGRKLVEEKKFIEI